MTMQTVKKGNKRHRVSSGFTNYCADTLVTTVHIISKRVTRVKSINIPPAVIRGNIQGKYS